MIQELINEGIYAVTRYEPKGEKTMRMNAQTGMIENGFVYVPSAAPWLEVYLHELTMFPGGTYDDQVDSTAQALEWVARCQLVPNLTQYYNGLLAALAEQKDKVVRIKGPPDCTHITLRSGKDIMLGPNRIVELREEDAMPFIRAGWLRIE